MQNSIEQFATDVRTGFRLQYLEVLNWGTFHHKIWRVEPSGDNSLMTGEIGSGKSTLVDAITTLLVPQRNITYNKAAGAGFKERTLRSYILGQYKNQKSDLDEKSKPVFLRTENEYSVLLANFSNVGLAVQGTLAQVFISKGGKEDKFFVFSENELTISNHFTDFGTDVLQLKKRLRALPFTKVFDTFSDYSIAFRSKFGIASEKALELFYQTVSMKSVPNLTEFVKTQMLEKTNVKEIIEDLKSNFENLTAAHEAVLKAKKQLDFLSPLVKDAIRYEAAEQKVIELGYAQQASKFYFAEKKSELLITEIERLRAENNTLNEEKERKKQAKKLLEDKKAILNSALESNEITKQIRSIESDIDKFEILKSSCETKFAEYQALAKKLNLPFALRELNGDIFYRSKTRVTEINESLVKEAIELDGKRVDLKIKESNLSIALENNRKELLSLRSRKTKIPQEQLALRSKILEALNLTEFDLPFVGELLRVRVDERDWEGSTERLLRSFSLSILVPLSEYPQVSKFVDKTNLRGRVVYYKVIENTFSNSHRDIRTQSLVNKLEVKSDSEFADWIEQQLLERYNLICCNTIVEFQRESFAITKEGQSKRGGIIHEKDDRFDIRDGKYYVMGWTNAEKISAIECKISEDEEELESLNNTVLQIESQQKENIEQQNAIRDFLRIEKYSEIDYVSHENEINKLINQKDQLENSSDSLRDLRSQIGIVEAEILAAENELGETNSKFGANALLLEQRTTALEKATELLASITVLDRTTYYPLLNEFIKVKSFNLNEVDDYEKQIEEIIRKQKEEKFGEQSRLGRTVEKKMRDYKRDYPVETSEVDDTVNSIPEFKKFLLQIEDIDLPRHEERFRNELKEHTIQDINIFRSRLEISEREIKDKVLAINTSLRQIEYTQGRYIRLEPSLKQDEDIKQFKIQLKKCMEDTLGTELYSEEKFLQVKQLLDRFNSIDLADTNWTTKVTDVREWFVFNASIRYTENDEEDEFISDSSGKSGGQKEKLAYTILASALAYQFGLEWNREKSKSFRFVAIDEAFGRGTDDSTRYGLELFKKLNLQLMIITPLQKINVIEDYINSVHFISNKNGNESEVLNLTKIEYKERKEEFLLRKQSLTYDNATGN